MNNITENPHLKDILNPHPEEDGKTDKKMAAGRGALFIPAGLFIGFGFGFISGNIPAGIFIGLGVGFAAFALSLFKRT